jgi:hypothetical protein
VTNLLVSEMHRNSPGLSIAQASEAARVVAIIHFNRLTLAAGDVIQSGSFGRLLRELHQGVFVNGRIFVMGMLAREYLWEVVRRDLKPSAPSRLNCVFACPTEEDARLYLVENNPGNHLRGYEVEPLETTSATHVAALSHCTMSAGSSFIDQMEAKGRLYWDGAPGDPKKGQEILFSCPVRVVRPL